jgi:hypothetical protein
VTVVDDSHLHGHGHHVYILLPISVLRVHDFGFVHNRVLIRSVDVYLDFGGCFWRCCYYRHADGVYNLCLVFRLHVKTSVCESESQHLTSVQVGDHVEKGDDDPDPDLDLDVVDDGHNYHRYVFLEWTASEEAMENADDVWYFRHNGSDVHDCASSVLE